MLFENNQSNLLVELSAEEQQLLSGGCYQSPPPPSCKPKKQKCGSDSQQYDQYPASERDESYPESNSMPSC
jgi:hypothetical protein